MNMIKTRRQEQAYDKTVAKIRFRFGSHNSIALRIYGNCDRELTSETIRAWFAERRVPTHIAFVLYEIMDQEIDPLTLCPWLGEHVELKNGPKASK